MLTSLPSRELVLLGAGHTNAHVLRLWRMAPIPDVRLTVVNDRPTATYSGMLPGVLAGLYPPERMEIDLVRLCAAAGARLLVAEPTGLNLARREVTFEDRPGAPFDLLSIGIGSVPAGCPAECDARAICIKPMQSFLQRLRDRLLRLASERGDDDLRILIVGGGAGGVEIALAMPAMLQRTLHSRRYRLTLVNSGGRLAPGLARGAGRLARAELTARGIEVLNDQSLAAVDNDGALLADGTRLPCDLAIWCTGAAAPSLLGKFGLALDERGFLLTKSTLQSVSDERVFVVGDSGSIQRAETAKAGVYAVRQGPVLWGNIQRTFRGQPLLEYRPQKSFLALLSTGDRRAILSYKGLAIRGGWCWRLKDRIDGRFIDMFHDYRPSTAMTANAPATSAALSAPPRCAGCGSKVGGAALSRALQRLSAPQAAEIVVGLSQPDDAAIVQLPPHGLAAATVDFFSAFLDDPYVVGRIAALHAASDLFAMGATPLAALAMATVPAGPEAQQEQLLFEMLAGAQREFAAMPASLVGGHTTEGPQTMVGFAMLGPSSARPRLKGGLRPGDQLVLTKPLGSGALLAAQMRAHCRAAWMTSLLEAMLVSNQAAAALAEEFDVAAMTDITGFGLAGHLLEMLATSGLRGEVTLSSVPLLLGAEEAFSLGIESTLAPANRRAGASIVVDESSRRSARYAALFDPQTSGGLLMGVPARHVSALLERLNESSDCQAAHLGEVLAQRDGEPPLRIR